MEKLQYYADMVGEVFEDSGVKEQINRFQEIDRMLNCDYENPKEMEALPWIKGRKYVTTAPADASNAATRAFASRSPILNVQPLSSEPDEYARVERIETALMWEFDRQNMSGKKPTHWQIVESAMRYCKVAFQTEYLPYTLKGREKDNYIKSVLRSKKFNWPVHHPGTVFAMDGPYGMYELVVKKSQYPVKYLVAKYGKSNPGVKKMLEQVDEEKQLSEMVWYFDVYTWEDRVQWGALEESGIDFEFRREEHKLPFIPWVVMDNQDPILKSVVDANLWRNANALRTIVFSKAVEMAANSRFHIQTVNGDLEGVSIDNTNPNQPIVSDTQTTVTPIPPPQLDQQLESIKNSAESDIFRTSVAQILASAEQQGASTTFSTLNAMLQAALTQLVLAQNAAERAEQMGFFQNLQWVEYSDIPLTLYRNKTKSLGDKTYAMGQEIMLQKASPKELPPELANVVTEIDTDFVYLKVKLQSTSITDKQAEITNGINLVERLGASREMVFEELGLGDYSIQQARRTFEDWVEAGKQAEVLRITQQVELEGQAKIMEMQAAQQQAQMEQQAAEEAALRSRGAGQFAGAEGMDTRSGGNPPAANAPGRGREQLSGQSRSGQGLA